MTRFQEYETVWYEYLVGEIRFMARHGLNSQWQRFYDDLEDIRSMNS